MSERGKAELAAYENLVYVGAVREGEDRAIIDLLSEVSEEDLAFLTECQAVEFFFWMMERAAAGG